MHSSKYDWTKDTQSWISTWLQLWLLAAAGAFFVPFARVRGESWYAPKVMEYIWSFRDRERWFGNDVPPQVLFQLKTFPVFAVAPYLVGMGFIASQLRKTSRFRRRIVVVSLGSLFGGLFIISILAVERLRLIWDMRINWHPAGWWYEMGFGIGLIAFSAGVWIWADQGHDSDAAIDSQCTQV